MKEISANLEIVIQNKYSVPASEVPFFMVQFPIANGSTFQFFKSKSFDTEYQYSQPVSTVMTTEDIGKLVELMKTKTEHEPCLMFLEHYLTTESQDEFVLFFQLLEKYFYPICQHISEQWRLVHNMQRLQKRLDKSETETPDLVGQLEVEAESNTDSNE